LEFNLEYLLAERLKKHFRKEYNTPEIKLGYLDISLEMTFVGQINH
jgi:hypothetical protein